MGLPNYTINKCLIRRIFNLLIIFIVIVQLRHPSIMFSQLGGENNAGDEEKDAPSQGKPETVLSRQN